MIKKVIGEHRRTTPGTQGLGQIHLKTELTGYEMPGKLIAFSGIDGAGKTTQINLLMEELKAHGRQAIHFWSRGGYTRSFLIIKKAIRGIFGRRLPPPGLSSDRDKAFRKPAISIAWMALAMCDLILVYGIYFRIMMLMGRIVVADRYVQDTCIDFRLNFPDVSFEGWLLWRLLCHVSPTPDVGFLLLIPIEESMRRSARKNEPFPDSAEKLQQRLEMYTTFASPIWLRLDCLQPPEAVQKNIRMHLNAHKP